MKGALLSGLIQNGSDCALQLREAAGQVHQAAVSDQDTSGQSELTTNANKLKLNSPKPNFPQTSAGIFFEMKNTEVENVQENETLTSSDEEFLDCEEGDDSL